METEIKKNTRAHLSLLHASSELGGKEMGQHLCSVYIKEKRTQTIKFEPNVLVIQKDHPDDAEISF